MHLSTKLALTMIVALAGYAQAATVAVAGPIRYANQDAELTISTVSDHTVRLILRPLDDKGQLVIEPDTRAPAGVQQERTFEVLVMQEKTQKTVNYQGKWVEPSVVPMSERQKAAQASVGPKPTIEDARTALIKLVTERFEKELNGHINAKEAKTIVERVCSKAKIEELQKGPVGFAKDAGLTFVGGWSLNLDERAFFVVVPMPGEMIWIHGDFKQGMDKMWLASIAKLQEDTSMVLEM